MILDRLTETTIDRTDADHPSMHDVMTDCSRTWSPVEGRCPISDPLGMPKFRGFRHRPVLRHKPMPEVDPPCGELSGINNELQAVYSASPTGSEP